MRRFLSRRWLGLHAAMVVIVVGFLELGWWQLRRAQGGNALSWGYTFEWPLFAGFVVVFWIKAMRDELHEARAREGKPATRAVQAAPAASAAPAMPMTLPSGLRSDRGATDGAEDEHEDEELAAYNAYLSPAERGGEPDRWLAGRACFAPPGRNLVRQACWQGRPGRAAARGRQSTAHGGVNP